MKKRQIYFGIVFFIAVQILLFGCNNEYSTIDDSLNTIYEGQITEIPAANLEICEYLDSTQLITSEHNVALNLLNIPAENSSPKIGQTFLLVAENLTQDEIMIDFGDIFTFYAIYPDRNSVEEIEGSLQAAGDPEFILGPAGSDTDTVILFAGPLLEDKGVSIDLCILAKGVYVSDGNVTDEEVYGMTSIQLESEN